MLFALDWMNDVWDSMVSWLLESTNNISIASISSAILSHWLIFIGCLLVGLVLCFGGFRYHKLVLGAIGSVLCGIVGWHLGHAVNESAISIPVVYATFMVIGGFCISFLLYFFVVFSGGWFFFVALLSMLSGVLLINKLWIAALLAALYSAFYIKFKLVMSALSGALLLGIIAFSFSPTVGAAVAGACALVGICTQVILKKRYNARKVRERREEIEKYPYGPGIAYGWAEPKSKV